MGIHPFWDAGDQFAVVMGQCSAGNDSSQIFVRIFDTIEGNGKTSHTVADEKYRNVGIFLKRHVHHHVGVIQKFVKIGVIGPFPLGAPMAPVVKPVGGDSGLVEPLGKDVYKRQDYEILEVARTGLTGLSRGINDVRYLP